MPKPRKGESHADYIERCIPVVISDKTAKDGAQAKAICESMWERRNNSAAPQASQYVELRGLVQTAEIRSASFNGRSHVVIPVVALVGNAIVQSMNSDKPELIPADLLAQAPTGWNGRPVLPNHPGGGYELANTPANLERYCFGTIFNSDYSDGRLRFEAWCDPERAALVGSDAESVISRALAGEMIEISVGALIGTEDEVGTVDGKTYYRRWTDLIPDHVALLPEGVVGACSNDAGCGAPRYLAQAKNTEIEMDKAKVNPLHTALRAFKRILGITSAEEGPSDTELRSQVWQALYAVEPGFMDVSEIYPADSTVIYCVCPDDAYTHYRRSFKLEGDSVTLNDDRVEVVMERKWTEKAKKAEYAAAADGGCKCHSNQPNQPTLNQDAGTAAPSVNPKEDTMSKVKELAGRLIGLTRSPFKESDRAFLESAPEQRLEELIHDTEELAKKEDPAPVVPPVVEPPPAVPPAPISANAAAQPVSEEEWLKSAPEGVRSLVKRHKEQEAKYRGALIKSLAENQSAFTAEQLQTRTTEDLQGLTRMLRLDEEPDYTGRLGALVDDDTDTAASSPAPKPYDIALAARNKAAAN